MFDTSVRLAISKSSFPVHHNIAAKPIESPSSNLVSEALTEPRDFAEGLKGDVSRAWKPFRMTEQKKVYSSYLIHWLWYLYFSELLVPLIGFQLPIKANSSYAAFVLLD